MSIPSHRQEINNADLDVFHVRDNKTETIKKLWVFLDDKDSYVNIIESQRAGEFERHGSIARRGTTEMHFSVGDTIYFSRPTHEFWVDSENR